jgi:hypothetical protein
MLRINIKGPAANNNEYNILEVDVGVGSFLLIDENNIDKMVNIPKLKTEYPTIYAFTDNLESVTNPIINNTTLVSINAL